LRFAVYVFHHRGGWTRDAAFFTATEGRSVTIAGFVEV